MKRRGEGLTTEDLAGTRGDDEDLRIEEDGRSEADPSTADQMQDAGPAAEGREGDPIAVGPADAAIIVEERRPAGPQVDSDDPARPSVGDRSDVDQATDRQGPAPATGESAPEEDGRQQADEATTSQAGSEASRPLIAEANREEFVAHWKEVQFRFVEEPRSAVQDADGLVAEVMQKVAQMFADERASLESQWSQGDQVSTEDLRLAFRRYREFFDRLLKA